MDIRKTVVLIEDTLMEGGQPVASPVRRVAVIAVIKNPLVARNDEDLAELIRDGEDLGRVLAHRAVEYVERRTITMLGKAAIVGTDGEPEHGQAILFPKFAAAVRETLDLASARLIGQKLILPPGSPIEVALQSVDLTSQAGSSLEVRVPGSPRSDEILVALVVAGTVAGG